jgi:pyruvate formate lyase activating enzyme
MSGNGGTTAAMLERAATIGRTAGLQYVYAGNIPGTVGDLENTRCPSCQETLIERRGYRVRSYRLTSDGRCPSCATTIPGRWSTAPRPLTT